MFVRISFFFLLANQKSKINLRVCRNKKSGWNIISMFFTVFLQSISPLVVHWHPHPELHIAGTNEHRGNLVVTYAWAPRVLSDESSLSLPYTSHHHPVCSVCSTARFVFWVKAGAAVALKNNGNKRGRPARVLAQGSHGHGGHVSQNVVSYMYTVSPSPLCTPTPSSRTFLALLYPRNYVYRYAPVTSICPSCLGLFQRVQATRDLYFRLICIVGLLFHCIVTSRVDRNKSFSFSLMIVNSIRDRMRGKMKVINR